MFALERGKNMTITVDKQEKKILLKVFEYIMKILNDYCNNRMRTD